MVAKMRRKVGMFEVIGEDHPSSIFFWYLAVALLIFVNYNFMLSGKE